MESMVDKFTSNRDEIRAWIESHNAFPARLKGAGENEYDAKSEYEIAFDRDTDSLEEISWEEFFEFLEDHNLALRYNNEAEGGLGMFEFVDTELVASELDPENELPDSGDDDVLRENITPDAE